MTNDIPEQVYLDAARARVMADIAGTVGPWDPEWVEQMIEVDAKRLDNRAAIESAYRAGQAAAPARLSALERDVIEKAKLWRAARPGRWVAGSDVEFHLLAAVDALTDATPADGQNGDGRG